MQTPQEQLQQAVDEVAASRKKVYDLINENAYNAAQLTIDSLNFTAQSKLDVEVQKVRMNGADSILDMAGFKVQQVNHTGKVQVTELEMDV